MLEKKVEAFLKQKQFHIESARILVGLSGGPDSLALLHYLWSQQSKWNLYIVAAHVDHMFRGKESYDEAVFVKEFCLQRNIPIEIAHVNVPEYIEKTGLSSQVAARECRYSFFREVIQKYEPHYLALGHHGDDQIETILMRLTRGSTGKARAGIPFLRPFHSAQIFRPFLSINRREIEEYCKRHFLEPRRDPSNEKDVYSRNRFRKVVVPFLQKENPQVHEQFQRFSEELQRDEEYLQDLAAKKMETVMNEKRQGIITIDIQAFCEMPIPLQRRGIQLILNYLYEAKPVALSALHIDHIFTLLKNPHPSGALDFPNGLKIIRSYNECLFKALPEEEMVRAYQVEISQPGEVSLPNGNHLIMEYIDKAVEYTDSNTLLFKKEDISLPIIVRSRKNGDRMTLKGMKGSKKIKDIFIDQKIALRERDSWPIITDRNGEILWVPGLKKANIPETGDNSNSYILLTYKKQ